MSYFWEQDTSIDHPQGSCQPSELHTQRVEVVQSPIRTIVPKVVVQDTVLAARLEPQQTLAPFRAAILGTSQRLH